MFWTATPTSSLIGSIHQMTFRRFSANDLARINQRPTALALLKVNLENYDKSASTYQTIAQIQLQGGDTASAVDALKKASALQPNKPQIRQMMQRLGINP